MSELNNDNENLYCQDCDVDDNITEVISNEKKPTKVFKCQHGRRKQYCTICGGASICIHNKRRERCVDCKGSQICEHNKGRSNCVECKGVGICSHNKRKRYCSLCNGSCICEHKKIRSQCVMCKGSQICEHNKPKSRCINCCGSQICEHNKQKTFCILCKGSQICEHDNRKENCKICNGSNVCKHKKIKSACVECDGTNICEHKKIKSTCVECHGNQICIHSKRKTFCKICKGSQICEHNKQKAKCKTCGGSSLCKSTWCETTGNKKYEGFCFFCYVNLFPDKQIVKNYKTKETNVVDNIKEHYPEFTWVADKKIQDGCSKKRPDLLLDLGTHIIIIEIDENAHTDYDCSCENKRLMELSKDVGHRPIVFIRFNPDKYVDKDGNKITSCWKINKISGILQIDKKKENEWQERLNVLREQIQYWIDNQSEKTAEIIELFY